MSNKLVEAKSEIEQALDMQPDDERGQSMLAGAYFRLGMYPLAIEIYEKLLKRHTGDLILHLNLGLSLLRAQQPAKALVYLRPIVEQQPEHARAWTYLGAAYWHLGQLQDAHRAFVLANRHDLASRVKTHMERLEDSHTSDTLEERLRKLSGTIPQLALGSIPPESWPRLAKHTAVSGVRPRHSSELPQTTPGQSSERMPSEDPWGVSRAAKTPVVIAPDGSLRISTCTRPTYARTEQILAIEGDLQVQRLAWRVFGRPAAHRKESQPSMAQLRGSARVVIAKPVSRTFHQVEICNQVLLVREDSVTAFAGTLEYEHTYLPMNEDITMLQLRGTGSVVLTLEQGLSQLSVHREQPVQIKPSALIGWIGDVVVIAGSTLSQGLGEGFACLCLRGEGTLLTTFG